MEKEELIALLEKLPPQTRLFVRAGSHGDDAYEPTIKVFEYQKKEITAYFDTQRGTHLNYPENYSGCVDVTKRFLQ